MLTGILKWLMIIAVKEGVGQNRLQLRMRKSMSFASSPADRFISQYTAIMLPADSENNKIPNQQVSWNNKIQTMSFIAER